MPAGSATQRLDYVIAARDQRFQQVADRVVRRLDRLERRGRTTTRAINSMSTSLRRNLSPALSAVAGGAGFGLLISRITRTGLAMQALDQRFQFATGTFAQGRRELEFVSQLSERLGLDFIEMSRGLSNLSAAARGTALEGDGIRTVFQAVAEASRVLHLDLGQIRGTFRALEQIMSKGRVQAEELRGQLGERLPGAFQIASRAVGVTTQELSKMLELGQLESVDFLPRFARQLSMELGNSLAPATKSTASEMARLGNAIQELEVAIAESGFLDFLTEATKLTTDLTRAMSQPGEIIEGWVLSFRDMLDSADRLANTLRASVGLGPLPDLARAQRRRASEDARRGLPGRHPTALGETPPVLTRQPRLIPAGTVDTVGTEDAPTRRVGTTPADFRRQAASARFSQILADNAERRQRTLQDTQTLANRLAEARRDQYRREQEELERLAELREQNAERLMALEIARYEQARENLADVVGSFIRGAGDIGGALRGVLNSISNAILDQFANQIAGSLLSGAAGGALTGLFGGGLFGFQRGGPVQRGRAVLVGEGGPEVFVPRTSGTILPNQALAAGGGGRPMVNLTFNIESTDGPGVRAALREAEPRLTNAALTAVATQQARPGSALGRQNRQAP